MGRKLVLVHRCMILRATLTDTGDGVPTYDYQVIRRDVRCLLDLQYLRPGKDQGWTPEAGRPADRTGVWFAMPDTDARPGDRVRMQRGPRGTFQIGESGTFDTTTRAAGRGQDWLIEAGVTEIPSATAGTV